jgi:hypothetical protein
VLCAHRRGGGRLQALKALQYTRVQQTAVVAGKHPEGCSQHWGCVHWGWALWERARARAGGGGCNASALV